MIALLVGGAAAVARAVDGETDTLPPTTRPAAPTTVAADSPEAREVERIREQVSAIRGLAWEEPLPLRVVSAEELSRRVREKAVESFNEDPAELAASETLLKLLGLIPDDLDYRRTLEDLLAGAVVGFYDDETKEMFVKDEPAAGLSPAARITVAHELTHALADQHFEIGRRSRELDDSNRTEELAALSAVAEGDAEVVSRIFAERHLTAEEKVAASASQGDASVYANVPRYLLRALLFPYAQGLSFIEAIHRSGGFRAVDSAYRDAPTSTEHILHPESYLAGEKWVSPSLPDVAQAAGCQQLEVGAVGEFDTAQILDEQLAAADSERAAAGWDGDSFVLVRCGTAAGVVDRWQAESDTEAVELDQALRRWAAGWTASARSPGADGRFSGPGGAGWVRRSGSVVDLVLADDAVTADRLASALGSGR